MSRLSLLNRYFNHGYVGRTDKALAVLLPGQARKRSAKLVCKKGATETHHTTNHNSLRSASFTLLPYSNPAAQLKDLIDYVQRHLTPFIHSAIVHGSVATDEIIHYSDFDGLLIIRDDVLSDCRKAAEACYHINKTFGMMLRFDPLQHHGWMIVSEQDLHDWPAAFFPPDLFNYSRSLMDRPLDVSIHYREFPEEYILSFLRYSERLIQILNAGKLPDNGYSLKSVLSEFMLLPSLYVAARDGKGVFKKSSFDMAAKDFTPEQWSIMNQVSAIRQQWPSTDIIEGFHSHRSFSPFTKYLQQKKSREFMHSVAGIHPTLFKDMSDFLLLMINKLK